MVRAALTVSLALVVGASCALAAKRKASPVQRVPRLGEMSKVLQDYRHLVEQSGRPKKESLVLVWKMRDRLVGTVHELSKVKSQIPAALDSNQTGVTMATLWAQRCALIEEAVASLAETLAELGVADPIDHARKLIRNGRVFPSDVRLESSDPATVYLLEWMGTHFWRKTKQLVLSPKGHLR